MNGRRKHCLKQQGMTLVEIMIVVVIMAMIAAAVGFSALGATDSARIDTAKTEVKSVSGVAELYLSQHAGIECPTLDELQQSRLLRRGASGKDPWGNQYEIVCQDGDVNVTSAGPDREPGTTDDVSAF